jgi:hypothetical protein
MSDSELKHIVGGTGDPTTTGPTECYVSVICEGGDPISCGGALCYSTSDSVTCFPTKDGSKDGSGSFCPAISTPAP